MNTMTMVQRVTLGSTDIEVSRLGLGTAKFGRNQQTHYPTAFEIPDNTHVEHLLSLAQSFGINLIDTAPAYGNSEERLGTLLTRVAPREDWVISTKVGEEFIDGQSYFNFTPEHIEHSIKRSLARLNTDYLDIVLVHSDGHDIKHIKNGVLDCLHHIKQKGLIRAMGMSTKTIEGGLLALAHADVVMCTYNLLHTEEKIIIEQAHAQNKGIFIKKVLASGHINKNPKMSVARALEFALKEPGTSSVIVGTIQPDHLKEMIRFSLL